jgi:hypothetical protein
MSDLSASERRKLEKLLGMSGGYVLDFSDRTFAQFFDDFRVAIDAEAYRTSGNSKANRLRAFWADEGNNAVGRVINALIDRAIESGRPPADEILVDECRSIAQRLLGSPSMAELSQLLTEGHITHEARHAEYTAYVSYAHADDAAWNHWVSDFCVELERGLKSSLRGFDLAPIYRGGADGPVAGALADELKQRVAASFAMIIVVHDNYVLSEWCRQELVFFKDRFGGIGLRERLYIVALSEQAMQRLTSDPFWHEMFPDPGQLWLQFYRDQDTNRPVAIYDALNVLAPSFFGPFQRLRDDLARRLRAAAAVIEATRAPGPRSPATSNAENAPAIGNATHDVFISHASENRDWADAVVEALESEGVRCWLAARDVVPGAPAYAAEIAKALKRSRLVVAIVSQHAGASPHVVRELTMAFDRNLPVVPLKVDDEPFGDALEYFLTTAQILFIAGKSREVALQSLLHAVRRHRNDAG